MGLRLPARIPGVIFLLFIVSACQTATLKTTNVFEPVPNARVLLMAPDVQLSEVQASGLLEPKAEWTAKAERHIGAALDRMMAEKNLDMVRYSLPVDPSEAATHSRLVHLHGAVGTAIRVHKYIQPMALPTKKDRFDWSLGPGVAALREVHGADYALFIYVRDSYTSPGRVAVIVAAAILGAGVQGGSQHGFASLVDLQNGEIVWFNSIGGAGTDLRKPDTAGEMLEKLLAEFPV